jgi:phage shock protein PspC (stress-responsive transcriptional regulator)
MKKTLTVNISGIVFHIDEDAYAVLHDYLQSIKKHFSRTQGGNEIISDIEARIAEMLKERIGDSRQVITIDDIEEVIQVIGQPSEFGDEFSEDEQQAKSASPGKTPKRLYRDPEHSVLGGVCGGLGAYFRTDPVWFRLAFILFSIVGIGTPLLIYVVLWIVIPEAKTAAERLEMKGERVNISSIEKSVREEINNLKNKFNDFTEGAKRTYKKKSAAHRSDLEGVGNALGKIAELFVKIILVFAGILLFLFGLSFILALVVALFGFGHNIFIMDSELIYVSFPALVEFFIGSLGNSLVFQAAFLLLIGIPLLMLIYAGIRLIFGLQRTRYIGLTAFNIWLVALLISGYYGFKVFRSFSHTGVYKDSAVKEIPAGQQLKLEMIENEAFDNYYRYDEYFDIDEANMIITNDETDFFYGIPQVEIAKTTGTNLEIEVFYRARGKSGYHAEQRAQRTLYHYNLNDSVLLFDQFFKLPEKEVWREQKVDIVVKLPVGCRIFIDENMQSIINRHAHSPYRLTGETWIMTESGLEESTYEVPVLEEPGIDLEQEGDTVGSGGGDVAFFGMLYAGPDSFYGFRA